MCTYAANRSIRQLQGALNADSSKMAKATDFKSDSHVSRDSPNLIPKIFFRKGGVARVR